MKRPVEPTKPERIVKSESLSFSSVGDTSWSDYVRQVNDWIATMPAGRTRVEYQADYDWSDVAIVHEWEDEETNAKNVKAQEKYATACEKYREDERRYVLERKLKALVESDLDAAERLLNGAQ
jgi:hypothetical protein